MTRPTHIIDSAHAMFDDILASVRPPSLPTPEQIRRAKRCRDLLWNSPAWSKLSEDDRIEELRNDCMFIAADDKELADKLVQECLLP